MLRLGAFPAPRPADRNLLPSMLRSHVHTHVVAVEFLTADGTSCPLKRPTLAVFISRAVVPLMLVDALGRAEASAAEATIFFVARAMSGSASAPSGRFRRHLVFFTGQFLE